MGFKSLNVYLLDKIVKLNVSYSLYKVIGKHFINWNKQYLNFFNIHLVLNIIILNVNVFGFKVKD